MKCDEACGGFGAASEMILFDKKQHRYRRLCLYRCFFGLFLCCFLFLSEREEPLSDLVAGDKGACAYGKGEVAREFFDAPAEQRPVVGGADPAHQRRHQQIGDGVAHGDIERKAEHRLPALFFVLEREIFVEEVAEDGAEEVVGGGGNPVAQVKYIVKHEHYAGAEKGVYNADDDKLPEGNVKKLLAEILELIEKTHVFLHFLPPTTLDTM